MIVHVVRRVGECHAGHTAFENPLDVSRDSCISAQELVVAKHPQVSRLGHRMLRGFGHSVGIGQSLRTLGAHQFIELLQFETGEFQVDAHTLQIQQFQPQKIPVPSSFFMASVIEQAIGPHLSGS